MMNSIGSFSPSSSTSHSMCLPVSRIRCSKDEIAVGGMRFKSASDALMVYLQQYGGSVKKETFCETQGSQNSHLRSGSKDPDSSQPKKHFLTASGGHVNAGLIGGRTSISFAGAKEDVEKLLTSLVHHEGNDILREVKVQPSLKQSAPQSQSHSNTALKQEVEAALLRSAQLLKKVTTEDSSSTLVADGINSTPAVHVSDLLASRDSKKIAVKQSGHIYSYRTSRPQRLAQNHLLSQTSTVPLSNSIHQQSRELRRHSSSDSLLPVSHKRPPCGKRSSSLNLISHSKQLDPKDIHGQVRSRSVSPGFRSSAASESVQRLTQSAQKSVPSWVGELNPSEVSDSVWASSSSPGDQNSHETYNVSNWVGQREGSDSVKDPHCSNDSRPSTPQISALSSIVKDTGSCSLDSNNSVTVDSPPGLNFSDLIITNLNMPNIKTQMMLTDGFQNEDPSMGKNYPKHSSPIKTRHSVLYSDTLPQHSRMLDSEYNGEAFLHNIILPQTVKLKKSMDNFVSSSENFMHKPLSSDLSTFSSTSLDTFSLLTGKPLPHTELVCTSSEPRESTLANPEGKGFPPIIANQDQTSTDDLDGDRSWEKMTSPFKPPVPIDSEDFGSKMHDRIVMAPEKSLEKTLSGGKQPGSMETLKNMLFKLQAEESCNQEEISKNEAAVDAGQQSSTESCMNIIPALQNYDFKSEPGGHSLEKALIHLNRLKKLVQTTAASGSDDENSKLQLPGDQTKEM